MKMQILHVCMTSMVVTYSIKLFQMLVNRYSILMSLLLLVPEAITLQHMFVNKIKINTSRFLFLCCIMRNPQNNFNIILQSRFSRPPPPYFTLPPPPSFFQQKFPDLPISINFEKVEPPKVKCLYVKDFKARNKKHWLLIKTLVLPTKYIKFYFWVQQTSLLMKTWN